MSATRLALVSVALAALALGSFLLPSTAGAARTCDPALTALAMAAVESACPCAGRPDGHGALTPWGKHRHYKKCIRTTIRDQVRASNRLLLRRCLRETVRCSNKSTCGTDGAVTCTVANTGTCAKGFCSNDPERACAVDGDCTVTSCQIAPSAAACDTGTPGTGSCCGPAPLTP